MASASATLGKPRTAKSSRASPLTVGSLRHTPATIVITGTSGAPGRSTLAINLAEALTSLGSRVLLVDADHQNSSLALMLGVEPGHTIASLFAAMATNQPIDLASFLTPVSPRLRLLVGVGSPTRLNELRPELFTALIGASQAFDFLVFDSAPLHPPDAPPTSTALQRFLVSEADQVVMLADSNLIGIDRLARSAAAVLRLRGNRRLTFALNRHDGKARHSSLLLQTFEGLAKQQVTFTLPYDRKTLAAALERGCTASAVRQRGGYAKAVLALATTLVTP